MASGIVLKGRKVVVVGVNASGLALTKWLLKKGAQVVLADTRSIEQVQPLLEEKIDLSRITLEAGPFQPRVFEGAQTILLTPGHSLDAKTLEAVRLAGASVQTELEFASVLIDEPLIAVGGTKGKSMTSAFIAKILEASGHKTFANVGAPLADYLNQTKASEFVVARATPGQLEGVQNFKPQVVLLLNLHEDDVLQYPNFETYLAANREILKNIDESTIVIANVDCPNVAALLPYLRGRIIPFGASVANDTVDGAWVSRNEINIRTKGDVQSFDVKGLRVRGQHNRENLAAATLAALEMGATNEGVKKAIEEFTTLTGRVEFVRRLNSVAFYNDACSTTVPAVIKTLQAFNEPVILIMGGKDKHLDYSALVPHVRHRVKNLILVGEAKERINRALGDFTETFLVGTLEESVLMAYQKSRSGDVVLLAPGCCGMDLFPTQEALGEQFKTMVLAIGAPRKETYI